MQFSKKVKVGLDETRMLILGAQILLGFQFREVFAEQFDQLPVVARDCDAAGLALMVLVVGLLIAPGPFHRLVLRGQDTVQFEGLIDVMATSALLPFALALGIDLFIAAERVFGGPAAVAIGAVTAALALAAWLALPYAKRRTHLPREGTMAAAKGRSNTPLSVRIEQMLTEARVVLPGVQALLGFQLAIVLTRPFEDLPQSARLVHAASLGLVAIAVILLMAPAAYHRIVFEGDDAEPVHRVGSLLLTAATLPLAAGLAGDVYVVIGRIAGSQAWGLGAGVAALLLLVGLWHVFPAAARARLRRGSAPSARRNPRAA